jgi:hypothetical protein
LFTDYPLSADGIRLDGGGIKASFLLQPTAKCITAFLRLPTEAAEPRRERGTGNHRRSIVENIHKDVDLSKRKSDKQDRSAKIIGVIAWRVTQHSAGIAPAEAASDPLVSPGMSLAESKRHPSRPRKSP